MYRMTNEYREIKDAVNTIFNYLNKMGGEDEVGRVVVEVCNQEHRTLQQNFMAHVLVPLIKMWADMYDQGYYDLRNEETCKTCYELYKLLKNKVFPFI